MDWKERQTSLENEMMVAKDTIWGLTARIIHLETEVKKLKLVVKYGAKKYSPKVSKAKKSEISRLSTKTARQTTSRIVSPGFSSSAIINDAQPTESAVSQSDEEEDNLSESAMPTNFNPAVKIEVFPPDADSDDNVDMSNGSEEDSDNSDIGQYPGKIASPSTSWKPPFSRPNYQPRKVNLKRVHGPYPQKSGAVLGITKRKTPLPTLHRKENNVGRKRDPVWSNFTVIENFSELGPARPTAICKKCNKVVSPQPGRLSKHIKNCKGDNSVTVTIGSPEPDSVSNTPVMPTTTVESVSTDNT